MWAAIYMLLTTPYNYQPTQKFHLENISAEVRRICQFQFDSGSKLRYTSSRLDLVAAETTGFTVSRHDDDLLEVRNVCRCKAEEKSKTGFQILTTDLCV